MTKHAVFQGTYSDLKFIKTRSVAAITIEIPIEQASAFVAAFGAPTPGYECPVAIARLDTANAASEPIAKERRRFDRLPYFQQAGMRCNEPAFWKFLHEKMDYACEDEEAAAETVRDICGVKSRAEIRDADMSGKRWARLNSDYEFWLRNPGVSGDDLEKAGEAA